ncbi:FMN-linked oxidoreductase [Hesseltinella vesiculosa]|uniref:FMN-linked oxidoreductase n=1 Tax=Hesseltinella vesiculosa TaxID=101127 RepID=A0A1X2GJG2_9FUNG|nr:FMN-linked oxidoreductase [Hesseltinella vesiculosa]
MTSALFTPLKVGKLALQHRLAMSPMTRNRATIQADPTDMMAEYYKQRATKGGLLITEAVGISATAGGYPNTPGLFTDAQVQKWKTVTDAVHQQGGFIFAQLWHLGRTTFSALTGSQIVSASDIPLNGISPAGAPYETPRPLTQSEIKSIAADFAQAAENAIASGFDGVEIHGANGYLVDQFINSSSNNRTDEYGGNKENRARFAMEVTDAVVNKIGAEKTAIRLSPYGEFQDMDDEDRVGTFSHVVKQLQDNHPNLAYIHLVEARLDQDRSWTLAPFRAAWKGPIIAAGNYTEDYKTAYAETEKHDNTLIAIGRAFLANPDLVERVRNHWPLNDYDRNTFYAAGEPKGYTDYPTYQKPQTSQA